MVDVALSGDVRAAAWLSLRAKMLERMRLGDAFFRNLTRGAAVGVLILLGGVILSLINGSMPGHGAAQATIEGCRSGS